MNAPLYGGVIDEHARHPRNRGTLGSPDAAHEAYNPLCGDRIRIELKLSSGRIAAARFDGDACKVSIAAASILTGMLEGLAVGDAVALQREKLLAALRTELRSSRIGCALLPLDVLRAALGASGPGSSVSTR